MAVGLKEIKRRIKSVKNTQQIAKAMEMVAAARLKRYQEKLIKLKDYVKVLEEGVAVVLPQIKPEDSLSTPKKNLSGLSGLVLFTADRGLCGSYNSNLLKETEKFIKNLPNKDAVLLFTIGKKGYRYFSRRLKPENIINFELSAKPDFKEIQTFLNLILSYFSSGKIKEVMVIRTQFISTSKHLVTLEKLLPFDIKKMSGSKTKKEIKSEYIFEPQPQEMVKSLVDKYLFSYFYNMFLSSQAAEHASRMIAMQGAGKNAKEMIEQLTLEYNKSRQAAITKELLEIVGGAEALK